MTRAVEVPSSNKLRNLQLSAKSYIKFSNNISSINVVSTLQDSQIDRSQLTKFTVGSNIKAVQPSCFLCCENLENVAFRGPVNTIGQDAFYGCTSLDSISLLSTGSTAINIGDRAFARSGIKSMKFGMNRSTSEACFIGDEVFASCYNLQNAVFSDKNFMAESMFEDCSALTSVSFASQTASMSPSAFARCTSLRELKLPADAYCIPQHFAAGCTSLTSFQFTEPGALNYTYALANYMLSGAPLTSITFPASLTSLDAFSSRTLQGLDQLKEIHFNGIPFSQIAIEVEQQDETPDSGEYTYPMNYVYYESTFDAALDYEGVDKSSFILKSKGEIVVMLQYAVANNIPVLAFVSKDDYGSPGQLLCGNCRGMIASMNKQEFRSFVQANASCYMFLIDYTTSHQDLGGNSRCKDMSVEDLARRVRYEDHRDYLARFQWFWTIANNVELKNRMSYSVGGQKNIPNSVIQQMSNFVKDFNKPSTTTTIKNASQTLVGTNCFGVNHDVTIFSKDGKSIEFKAGSSGIGSIGYYQTYPVDSITVDDFRYGQWYANAKKLKAYADDNYIPVLAIASQGSSYKQSLAFERNVFSSSTFQDYATSKKILLCKVTSSSFLAGEGGFLLDKWMDKAGFAHLPLVMMYWLQKDGGTIIGDDDTPDTTVDARFDDYAYFSTDMSDSKVDDVECINTASELTSWIDSLTAYNAYVPNAAFQRPQISSYMTRYPRYRVYTNQLNDSYGRYYPVESQKDATASSYEVNVNGSSGSPVAYTLKYGASPAALPPQGTYQYFTMLSDESTTSVEYESSYQISGLLFKVGSTTSQQTVQDDSYSYSAKTEASYLQSIGFNDSSNISRTVSSFLDDLYVYTDDGDPTTEIDADVAGDMPFLYNVLKTIELKQSIMVGSKSANAVNLWLSSEAQVQTVEDADDDDETFTYKELVPGSPQYVISAQVLGTSTSQSQLLWMKEFSNAV